MFWNQQELVSESAQEASESKSDCLASWYPSQSGPAITNLDPVVMTPPDMGEQEETNLTDGDVIAVPDVVQENNQPETEPEPEQRPEPELVLHQDDPQTSTRPVNENGEGDDEFEDTYPGPNLQDP